MLSTESVLFWNEVEQVLYEENGYKFVVVLDLFNNHTYFYCRKDNVEVELSAPDCDDICYAIDNFNKFLSGECII